MDGVTWFVTYAQKEHMKLVLLSVWIVMVIMSIQKWG